LRHILAFRIEGLFNYEDSIKEFEIETLKEEHENEMKQLKEAHNEIVGK